MSINWARNDETGLGGWYRCPQCGMHYLPASSKGGRIACNMIYVLQAPDASAPSGKGAGSASAAAPSGDGRGGGVTSCIGETLAPGEVRFLPAWWPDTATTALENRMKEIVANLEPQIAKSSPEEILTQVYTIANVAAAKKSYFAPMQVSEKAKYEIGWINENTPQGKAKPFSWEHLNGGFLGAQYLMQPNDKVLDEESIIKMWVYSRSIMLRSGIA